MVRHVIKLCTTSLNTQIDETQEVKVEDFKPNDVHVM